MSNFSSACKGLAGKDIAAVDQGGGGGGSCRGVVEWDSVAYVIMK